MLWNDLDSWRVKPGPTVDLMSMCVCVHVSCRLQKRAWKMRHWRRYAHVIIHNYMYVCIYIIIMTLSQPEGQSKSACCWIGRTARPLKEWRHVTSIFTTSMRHVIELVTLTSHPWPEKPKKTQCILGIIPSSSDLGILGILGIPECHWSNSSEVPLDCCFLAHALVSVSEGS